MLKDFYSVSDHFGTLCIKGLKSLSDKIKRSFFSEVDLGPLQYPRWSWKLFTIIAKSSILDVAAVLDPPLLFINSRLVSPTQLSYLACWQKWIMETMHNLHAFVRNMFKNRTITWFLLVHWVAKKAVKRMKKSRISRPEVFCKKESS